MHARFRFKALATTLLVLLPLSLHAQPLAEGGARHLAMGRAGIALGERTFGLDNPATWATVTKHTLAVEASQAYGLSELRLGGFAGATPLGPVVVALTARTYGFEDYRETRIAVGLGKTVGLSPFRELSIGLAIGYDGVSITDHGSKGVILANVGIQAEIAPRLRAGLGARNLSGVFRNEEDKLSTPETSETSIAAGLAYQASDHALLLFDVVQDIEAGPIVRAGVEIRPIDLLALRAGASGGDSVHLSGGAGVHIDPVTADFAVEIHESLGLTPAVSVEVSF